MLRIESRPEGWFASGDIEDSAWDGPLTPGQAHALMLAEDCKRTEATAAILYGGKR